MKSIIRSKSNLFSAAAFLALCSPLAHAGTTATTFSFQKEDLRKDGVLEVNGAAYAGVVDGFIVDINTTSALTTAVTATIGNSFQSQTTPPAANGRNHVGLFSYDLSPLEAFITANTSSSSSVTVTSVAFKLVTTGGGGASNGTISLFQTDPFTTSATWPTYDGTNLWTTPFQSGIAETQYRFTGGGTALSVNLGGTSPSSASQTAGTTLEWTSSANFVGSLNNALGRADKKLYLMAARSLGNADGRVNVNTSTAVAVDARPELVITLAVNTFSDWTGASSTSWATAANWTAAPGAGDNVRFNNSSIANLATVLNQDFSLNGLALINPTGPVSIGGANSLTLGAGGLDLSAATQNLTITAPLVVSAAQTWNVAINRILSVGGTVTGSGGLTLLGAGKVSLGASNILPNGATAGNLSVGGTLDLNGSSQSVNALTGSGIVDNAGGGASVLTVGNNNAAGTFGGILQNTSGTLALQKTGSGSLTLTGASTYSGGFTNSGGGDVTPNNNGAFGSGPVVSNAGQLYGTATTTFANTLTLNGSTLRIGGGNSRTITWNGPVTATGISGLSADGGTTGITLGSTLNIAGATISSFANGTSNKINGIISGAGGILNVTGGTLQLSGANTYSGTTTLSGSGLLLLQPTGTISNSSNVVINSLGNLMIRNTVNWLYTGTITGDGTGSVSVNSGTNATLAGTISGVTTVNANSVGTNTTVSGAISGAVGASIQGGAILTLSGDNSAMSGSVNLNGGVANTQLNIKSATALGTGLLFIGSGNNGKIDNTSGSSLTLSTNNAQTWNSDFTFVGTDDLNLGTGAVTLGGNRGINVTAKTLTVGGVIDGALFGITKTGGGALNLTGTNTYTGDTIVNGGDLGGTGTIGGSVTVGAVGNVAPGVSAGTLTINGGLNVAAMAAGTGKLKFELAALAGTNDRITVVGTLTLGVGALGFGNFDFTNLGGLQAGTYSLITSGGITGGDSLDGADLSGVIGSFNGALSISGNNIVLTVTGGGNIAPTISDIANPPSFPSGGNSGALAFTITDEDLGTVALAGSSSNTVLVPNGTIVFGGSAGSRTVTVTPVSGKSGTATITVTVTDNGTLTAQDTFVVTVTDNYLSWASSQVPPVTGGPNGDSDNDGVKNLIEYALVNGGERGVLSSNTITFTKRGAPYGSDVTYDIESSTLLSAGSWATLSKPSPVVESPTSISYTFTPGSPVKNFARLKVTGP